MPLALKNSKYKTHGSERYAADVLVGSNADVWGKYFRGAMSGALQNIKDMVATVQNQNLLRQLA